MEHWGASEVTHHMFTSHCNKLQRASGRRRGRRQWWWWQGQARVDVATVVVMRVGLVVEVTAAAGLEGGRRGQLAAAARAE